MRSRFFVVATLIASLSASAFAARAPLPAEEIMMRRPSEQVSRAAVRAKLAEMRRANVARFHAYRTAKVYPSNIVQPGALNVWRDFEGHLCAAATIIYASGETELVQQVADTNNFIRLKDVSSGPLMNWIITSGLTQEELVAIQRPFIGVAPTEPARPPVVAVDERKKAAETARLAAVYQRTEAAIATATKRSLDVATDRLMAHPDLARMFLEGVSVTHLTPVSDDEPHFARPPA